MSFYINKQLNADEQEPISAQADEVTATPNVPEENMPATEKHEENETPSQAAAGRKSVFEAELPKPVPRANSSWRISATCRHVPTRCTTYRLLPRNPSLINQLRPSPQLTNHHRAHLR